MKNEVNITKVFHSCILLECGDTKILIDPGTWIFGEGFATPSDFSDVDSILITHDHTDHFDPDAIREIKKGGCSIITNSSIAEQLHKSGVRAETLMPGESMEIGSFHIKATDSPHGPLPVPEPENIGFIIDNRIFHPGDSLLPLGIRGLDVLLAPIAAPWMRLTEGIEFTKSLKPKIAVPIHDGYMKYPFALNMFTKLISDMGIDVRAGMPGEHLTI